MGYNAIVAKLFSDIPAFTATVETALTNATDKSRLTLPMKMMKLKDQMRIEVDLVKMKGAGVALQGLASMQNIGMARMTSIVSPGDRSMVVLFPDVKFHTRVGLSGADLPDTGFKVTKRQVGKDTIQGQPCLRMLVTLTSTDGVKQEATTWEAPALNRFPVRIFFKPEGSSMTMTFSDVRLTAPPEESFKVPSDSREFEGMSGLMQEAMTRALNPGAAR